MEAGKLDQTWVESLLQGLESKPNILREDAGRGSCSIHRVPPTIRQHDPKACTPLVVSLGPFHHGNQMLQVMEEHKWRYLHKALSLVNTTTPSNGLETFLSAIEKSEQNARKCYSEIIPLDSRKFVQMMVLDGCFILLIVLIANGRVSGDRHDPIFSQIWPLNRIRRDMLLLENQIPFSVLQDLFDLMNSSMQISDSLVSIFSEFFQSFSQQWPSCNVTNPTHLLHLLQSCLSDTIGLPSNATIEEIPSATRLREAGVKFKCVDKNSFLDIIFKDGELRIPPLDISDSSCSIFLNLVAFEQCYTEHCHQYFTAYRLFMDWLIDSADDVLILRREGIIKNWLGSDEEVANLFNKLGRDVTIGPCFFYLSDVVKDINHYRRRRWHSWRANLMEKYFYNPWAIISLIGAIILLLLTTFQTFFAIFS